MLLAFVFLLVVLVVCVLLCSKSVFVYKQDSCGVCVDRRSVGITCRIRDTSSDGCMHMIVTIRCLIVYAPFSSCCQQHVGLQLSGACVIVVLFELLFRSIFHCLFVFVFVCSIVPSSCESYVYTLACHVCGSCPY